MNKRLLQRRVIALLLLLVSWQAHTQDDTYDGGTLDEVTVPYEETASKFRQLLDVDMLLHSLGARKVANDDRLVDFVEGFMERNGIGVLTISYVDSDDLWPSILKNNALKKIEKAPDATLVAGILFFPEQSVDGEKRNFTARLSLEGKTNEVYDLLNISGDDMALISEETSDELIGDQAYSKPKEAQDKVVNAMIAALQKVEQNADPTGPTGQVVTFQKKANQKHGFDLQTYDQLSSDYPTIVVGGQSYTTAWKSLQATQPDEVIAIDTSGQEVTFELDGIPVNGALAQGKYTLSLQGSTDGTEGELLAKVGETTVGKLNTVTYSISTIDLKIVPVNGAGSGISQTTLQSALDSIYAPAVASWNVQVLDNQELGNAWDPEGNGLDDGETGSFTNYTDEMNDLIKAFKSQNDRDKDAYYIFLVKKAENPSKLGYMPRKKQWGFVFTNGQSTDALTKTIAHELGHGVYRLEHTFSEKGLPKGQTNNLMDYSDGEELYKYQWDYVHDPASVVTLFDDEEEGAYTDQTYIQKVLQQLRCASFDDVTTLRLSQKTGAFHGSFETVTSVKLTITDKDIVLNRVANPEEKQVGGQNRNTAWFGKYGEGLSIQVESNEVSDFHKIQDYIFPGEDESSLGDVKEFLAGIKDKGELSSADIEELRSIANCGSENLTVAYRYQLIKEVESLNPVSLTPIYEDLILDLIENHREDVVLTEYANDWLDLLASDRSFLKKLFYGIDEYQWWSGSEANQTRFMQAIQALWQISKYNNKQNTAYTYDQYSLNSSGEIEVESPYTLVYGGTKLFPRVEYDPVVTSEDVRFNFEVYTQQGTKYGHFNYHPFQPIHLIKEDQRSVSYLQYDMPAIALVPLMDADNFDRGIERAGLTADIVLTITGVGNLTKLRHLSKLQKVGRILLAGIEISSSTLDIVLDYTDICTDEEFCPKLKQYNFYLQMALLGGEGMSTLYKGLMESSRKSAKEAYQESRNALIAKHGEESDEIRALDEHFEVTVLVGKYDWNLVRKYFQHIQEVTNRSVHPKQIEKLKEALRAKEYKKLSSTDYANHRKLYNQSKKEQIIREWEQNTGQDWPTYQQDQLRPDGSIRKRAGQPYDLHHIIEQNYEGPHEWWNAHPARFPDEHQGGIHGAGSPARELFK